MTLHSLFAGVNGPSDAATDVAEYTMAVMFKSSVAGEVTAVRFWRPNSSPPIVVDAGIFSVNLPTGSSGTLLASKLAVSSPVNMGAWQEITFDTPLTIEADTWYKAAVHSTTDSFYGATANYFSTGGVSPTGVVSGVLTAPGQDSSGIPSGVMQGSFHSGAAGALTYPESGFNWTNYWIDVVFDDGAGALPITVSAGLNQNVETGSEVTLTATTSNATGTVTSEWTQISGPAVSLSNASSLITTFTPTEDGVYEFQISVADDDSSDTDSVQIVVTDPPISGTLWMKLDDGTWIVQAEGGTSTPVVVDEPHVYRPESYGAVGDGVTDDTAAIQACIDAAVAAIATHNYSVEIRFSSKVYVINGPCTVEDFSYGQLHIPFNSASEGNPKHTVVFRGVSPAQPLVYWDQDSPQNAGTVLKCTLTSNPLEGGGGAVLAGMFSPAGVPTPDDITTFSNQFVVVENLQFQIPFNIGIGGLCLRRVAQAKVDGVAVFSDRYRNSTPSMTALPTNENMYGYWTPDWANNAWNEIGSFSAMGVYVGIIGQEHLCAQNLAFVYCQRGLMPIGGGLGQTWPDGTQKQLTHGTTIDMLLCEAVNYWIWLDVAPMHLMISQLGGEGVTNFIEHIHDPNNTLTGEVHFYDLYDQDPIVNGASRLKVINDNRSSGKAPSTPALPASGVALRNPFWRDATVYLSAVPTSVKVDGLNVGPQTMIRVPTGKTIELTYSSAPSWFWILD